MCEICHQTPCASRCPNASNEPVVFCTECGEPLYAGENAFILNEDVYCEDCVNDNAIQYLQEFADMRSCEVEDD